MCDDLTKSKASYLGSGAKIQGYIRQDGRKVKFRKFNNLYEFGVYIGDDIKGSAITYFLKRKRKIIENSNPFSLTNEPKDRYKCDLDGKFRGLDFYEKPIMTSESKMKELKTKILNGEKLNEKIP